MCPVDVPIDDACVVATRHRLVHVNANPVFHNDHEVFIPDITPPFTGEVLHLDVDDEENNTITLGLEAGYRQGDALAFVGVPWYNNLTSFFALNPATRIVYPLVDMNYVHGPIRVRHRSRLVRVSKDEAGCLVWFCCGTWTFCTGALTIAQ